MPLREFHYSDSLGVPWLVLNQKILLYSGPLALLPLSGRGLVSGSLLHLQRLNCRRYMSVPLNSGLLVPIVSNDIHRQIAEAAPKL
jgi:hypothetical protein